MVNRMVVKVCRYRIRCHIICRMLYRRKRINLLTHRQYYNTSRMLSCCSSNTYTALYNSIDFTGTFMLSTLFVIVLHISKRSLICQCTNGSCSEGLTVTKDNLCIFVRLTLIFTREIKVDIRLLISFKSKEGFKRNIKAIFYQLLSTIWTISIRHITSCHTCKLFYFL